MRGGDYAHAGDIEAIDLLLQKLPDIERLKQGNVLDLGCGYGGTASHMQKKGFATIWGIDIDENAIDYAKQNYPSIQFTHLDAKKLAQQFTKNFFSFIYLFNVIYAVSDKEGLLKTLAEVSQPEAILAIFDYSNKKKQESMRDFSGKEMYPLDITSFTQSLARTQWKLLNSIDITEAYIFWYENFLNQLSSQRTNLLKTYKEADVKEVENLFKKMVFDLKNGELGGTIIFAKKQ